MLSRTANRAGSPPVEDTVGTSLFAAVVPVLILIHALSVPVIVMVVAEVRNSDHVSSQNVEDKCDNRGENGISAFFGDRIF